MSELQEFSALVGDIYDASLDPPLWSGVLEKLTRFVSGHHANIFVENSARQATDMTFSWGDDPHYRKLYLEKYARINPLFPASLFYDVEEIFAVSDVIAPARFRRTRFYKEWLAPQGVLDAVVGVLEKSRTNCAMLAIPRHHQSQGFVDKKTRERMRLVVPHVRRAILVGKAIDLQKANAATLADAFDAISAAVYLVDKRGRIVHANRSGIALLAEDDMLRGAGDRLRARDPAIDRIVQEIFASAEADKDLSVGSKGTAIPLTAGDGERYLAHVLPLRCAAGRPVRSHHPAAVAVFVQKTSLARPTLLEAVSGRFRLTPSELRVLFAIVEIGGVPEVAPVLGVSEETVKTHLKRLFAKTGTKRQADLVKLVAEFANPLFG